MRQEVLVDTSHNELCRKNTFAVDICTPHTDFLFILECKGTHVVSADIVETSICRHWTNLIEFHS